MPGFQSPLGNKQMSGQSMREVVIPDESNTQVNKRNVSQNQAPQFDEAALREFNNRMNSVTMTQPSQEQVDIENQFREARKAKLTEKERLNDGAKRRIEMLVGMTRHIRSFNIGNDNYTLQTLRDQEMRDAILGTAVFDATLESPFEMRKQLLARSLVNIAGMDANQFFGSSYIEEKLEGLGLFDHYLLGRLYDEYLIMVKEAQEKYSIKNAEQAQQVVEDLKK